MPAAAMNREILEKDKVAARGRQEFGVVEVQGFNEVEIPRRGEWVWVDEEEMEMAVQRMRSV